MIASVPPCGLPLNTTYQVEAAEHRQVVIAMGDAKRSSYSTLSRWQWRDACWNRIDAVPARNGARGWHKSPWDWSYLSPIGSFGLTDAGGQLRAPRGTRLPYDHSRSGFAAPSPGVFDYVVAINFNRVAGRSPLNLKRPDPKINDGGIWLHVSGTGATRGCISVSKPHMRSILKWLDPAQRPVIVMGPRGQLR